MAIAPKCWNQCSDPMLKPLALYLALLGFVLAIVLLTMTLWRPSSTTVPVTKAPAAPFGDSIAARGIIEGVDANIRLAPAVAGLVSKVFVQVGDNVHAGDPLIEQDGRDAAATVAAQEAHLAALRTQLSEADVALAAGKDQWNRMEKLAENKVSSVDERQRAFFSVQAATMRLENAKAELESAEAQLARSKVQLQLLTIRAPRDGTILEVNIRPGEYAALNALDPVILLGQVEKLQLRADVDEENASRVRPGCAAVALFKGNRGAAIPLQFVRIEPRMVAKRALTGESGARADTRVLQIIFHFEQPSVPVYVGQQMDVFLDAAASPMRPGG
jgi:HlyD family secretion protein